MEGLSFPVLFWVRRGQKKPWCLRWFSFWRLSKRHQGKEDQAATYHSNFEDCTSPFHFSGVIGRISPENSRESTALTTHTPLIKGVEVHPPLIKGVECLKPLALLCFFFGPHLNEGGGSAPPSLRGCGLSGCVILEGPIVGVVIPALASKLTSTKHVFNSVANLLTNCLVPMVTILALGCTLTTLTSLF